MLFIIFFEISSWELVHIDIIIINIISLACLVGLGIGHKFADSWLITYMTALLGMFFHIAYILGMGLIARELLWSSNTTPAQSRA